VAIGSSSTQGAGASSPAASYPSKLAVELQTRFPRNNITVLNRGVGGEEVREGLNRIRATGADVVLIDPQFAPKVIAKPEAEKMVGLIAVTAKTENVDLYHRFEVMRRWHDIDQMTFDKFVSPDGLHMNDWSYACLATGLGRAIAEAAVRPVASASAVAPKR